MKNSLTVAIAAGIMVLALAGGVAAQVGDYKDCKDHPLFPTRMPDYRIADCKVEDFGFYEFYVTKGPKIPVEGKFTFIAYIYTGEASKGAERSGRCPELRERHQEGGRNYPAERPELVGEREDRQGRSGSMGPGREG